MQKSAAKPSKSSKSKQRAQGSPEDEGLEGVVDDDEEIDSDEEILSDSDVLSGAGGSGGEDEEDDEEAVFEGETAAEKRLRLAQQYLDNIRAETRMYTFNSAVMELGTCHFAINNFG